MMRMSWPVPLAMIVLTLMATPAGAQQPAAAAPKFTTEQLEQVVAPIALYPDSLVAAVLMAATYPLEVVEADRWLDQNKDLKGDALNAKLKEVDWDPSIKSIVTVPEVLKRMSQNLDWTRDLGDAFLGQQEEVMKAVQTMRKKANDAGNLKDTEQQNVEVQQDQTIIIEQSNPEVVYVPEYGTEVYGGGWGYSTPYYPSMYPVGWGLIGFGAGIWAGHALWGNCDWHGGDLDINHNNFNNFNNKVNNNWQNRTDNKWNHNAEHRKGVGYKNGDVAKKYGGGAGSGNRVNTSRGRPSQLPAGSNRPGGAGGAGNRPGGAGGAGGNRPSQLPAGGNRPGAGGGGTQRPSGGGARSSQQPSRPSGGYSGSSQPRSDRAASNRGGSSRGYSSGGSRGYSGGSRSGGGGSRGGGGRGGGGRGGGRR
jgi:Protein of unknown function (DUF3300)